MSTKPTKKRKKGFWYYVSVESPLDERQERALKKIQVETLGAALILTSINTFIMDFFYKWCENNSAALLLIAAACCIYFTVRSGVKGCLFGVKGARAELLFMTTWAFLFVFDLWQDITWAFRGVTVEITRDGMLTFDFCGKLLDLSFFIEVVVMAVFLIREKKAKERGDDNSENDDR